ncbi:MAG: site-specific DNA-methyltransferase [Chloroflexota bacterium]
MTVGDEPVTKAPSIIEVKAYRDYWADLASYLQMMYDRLVLIRGLLRDTGAIYVHMDPRLGNYMKVLLDEVFGMDSFVNEIAWKRQSAKSGAFRGIGQYGRIHEVILFYSRSETWTWNQQFAPYDDEYTEGFYRFVEPETGRRYQLGDLTAAGTRRGESGGALVIDGHTVVPAAGRHWALGLKPGESVQAAMDRLVAEVRVIHQPGSMPRYKRYLDEMPGVMLQDVWTDIRPVPAQGSERLNYATQKPEGLLERIIRTSSNEGGLVADFFCGSGTTLAVAEKLGRRWIGVDLGRFAVHTTRKRLLGIPSCKPFEVLNLGKYERQYWQGVTTGRDGLAYVKLILQLYCAEPLPEPTVVHGMKAGIAVHVGPIDSVVTIEEVGGAVEGAIELGYKRLHVLGWDWQMGLKETVVDQALAQGVQLSLKRIPSEIMDARAREKGDVQFFELNYVDASAELNGRSARVFLEDFIIADLELVKPEIQERIERFSDYVDYWAVDFDFQGDTFHNQWQSFRTRKQPRLELESAVHTYDAPGPREILVKVIDIFGNDTTKLLRVDVP